MQPLDSASNEGTLLLKFAARAQGNLIRDTQMLTSSRLGESPKPILQRGINCRCIEGIKPRWLVNQIGQTTGEARCRYSQEQKSPCEKRLRKKVKV
jgi:hypothetical protein